MASSKLPYFSLSFPLKQLFLGLGHFFPWHLFSADVQSSCPFLWTTSERGRHLLTPSLGSTVIHSFIHSININSYTQDGLVHSRLRQSFLRIIYWFRNGNPHTCFVSPLDCGNGASLQCQERPKCTLLMMVE